jgi:hypothetical protein
MSNEFCEIRKWAPSETKKEIVFWVRARYVTPGVTATTVAREGGREGEREEGGRRKPWMTVITWTN